jgi:hypothetical protein
MLLGELNRKLRQLNKNLWIFIGENPYSPAGLYYYDRPLGYGITKGVMLPERTVIKNGRIVARGWKNVLDFCFNKRLTRKRGY